jgi:hypothetical protein
MALRRGRAWPGDPRHLRRSSATWMPDKPGHDEPYVLMSHYLCDLVFTAMGRLVIPAKAGIQGA